MTWHDHALYRLLLAALEITFPSVYPADNDKAVSLILYGDRGTRSVQTHAAMARTLEESVLGIWVSQTSSTRKATLVAATLWP